MGSLAHELRNRCVCFLRCLFSTFGRDGLLLELICLQLVDFHFIFVKLVYAPRHVDVVLESRHPLKDVRDADCKAHDEEGDNCVEHDGFQRACSTSLQQYLSKTTEKQS